MKEQPSYFKGHSHPVEQVSWNGCNSFVEALNLLNIAPDDCKFIMPSSAHWEYAEEEVMII